METTTVPSAATLLCDWTKEQFPDWHSEVKPFNDLYDQIEMCLPTTMNDKGLEILPRLTMTVPRFSIFDVDGVSICDPNFFDTYKKHLNTQAEKFKPVVERWLVDGTILPIK